MNDTIDKSTHVLTSTLKRSEIVFVCEKYSSFTKLQRYFCFMLSLLPKHKHFRGPTAQITDPAELAIAKDELFPFAQSGMFPVVFKHFHPGIPIKRPCRIAGYYSPFIGPGGIIQSTGRIQRLAEMNFENKHPIILDSRHLLVKLILRHLHFARNHQQFICGPYLRIIFTD